MKGNIIQIEDIFGEKMIRAKDLSKIFVNTSQATYNNWFQMGLLPRHKICGGVYYKLSEVKELIENSREIKEVA